MFIWALINVAISVAFGLVIRAPLIRAYLVVNFVLIINPVFMYQFFGATHPRFIEGDPNYVYALMYMAMFNIILCGGFMAAMIMFPRVTPVVRRIVTSSLNDRPEINRIVLVAVMLAFVGFAGKLVLETLGVLRMGQGGAEEASGGGALQAVKAFADFGLLAMIFLGELRLSNRGQRALPVLNAALIGLALASTAVAFVTGSRMQVIVVLIIMALAYRDQIRRYWPLVIPGALAAIPSTFMIFPLLGYYRINQYDFSTANYMIEQRGLSPMSVLTEVLVTRLNYLEVLARAMTYVGESGANGGTVYLNNIVGVIPRLIWPGKPEIYNDSQLLGHQLGLLATNDNATSIGLQVVGESFFEYGWFGLWVALFQASIFALIHKNLYFPGRPVAMAIYTFACLYILQRDGYFAVVPGLVWLAIGVSVFFSVFAVFLRSPRGHLAR